MKKNLKDAQIFTPLSVANQMLDLVDESCFSEHETFFFEPSAGDGAILVAIVERIFNVLEKKYNDPEKSLADTLHKFYAVELDETLVPKARMRIYEWACTKVNRELSPLETYLIARSLQESIECKDFFEVMSASDITSKSRKLKKVGKTK